MESKSQACPSAWSWVAFFAGSQRRSLGWGGDSVRKLVSRTGSHIFLYARGGLEMSEPLIKISPSMICSSSPGRATRRLRNRVSISAGERKTTRSHRRGLGVLATNMRSLDSSELLAT